MVLVSVFLLVYSYVVYQKVSKIGASPGRLIDESGNGTWDSVKAGYLGQVEKALASVGHREKKQVLEDVRSHLDQRFSELASDEQTWENMQAIITEMGPASDYAELLETGTPESCKKKVLGSIIIIAAVVAVAIIFAPYLIIKYTEIVSDRIEDNIDFPFVDDPEVIGKWTSVDLVDSINRFNPKLKLGPDDLFLNELVFHENGRILSKNDKVKNGFWLKWTRGIVICPDDKTAEKYHIEEIDGEKYMFYEWKSGDYTVRHRRPSYYVLKKEPVETDIAVMDLRVRGCYDDQLRAKGFYDVTASIHNKGEQQTGQFGVYFYRGDPATSKPRTHAAGPVKSGGTWNEYAGPFELNEGTNLFSVVIDPGNKINDPDRSNNTKTTKVTVKDGRIAEETVTKKPLSDFVSSDIKPSHTVDFEVTSSDFTEGDWIEITKLMGTSPKIMTGEKYTIRGKYRLVSHDTAKLHIYATNGETSSNQGPEVKSGEGEFIRTFTLIKEGSKNLSYLHLSFYPADGGSSFGNTYFKQKKAADESNTRGQSSPGMVKSH
jgi:hypothetical protein